MTVRAIAGLVGLNLGFAAVGGALLWGARGFRWWTDLLRLTGLAYLLGLASMIVVLTAEVVLGVPFSKLSASLTASLLVAVGVGLGLARGHGRPGLAPPGWRLPTPTVFVALMVGCLVLWLEASFRAARLQPMWSFDAWWVWTIRAKALTYFGELGGPDLVRGDVTANETYPPGLSLVQALAFEAMGSVDTVTLHLQNWFLVVGFLAATFGVLAGRVRAAILAPVVLLTIAMPTFADIAIWPLAEPLLAYLVAVASMLVVLWLEDSAKWRLACAAVLLAGAVLVKREAAFVVLCVLFAALVASWPRKRLQWPSIAVTALAIIGLSASWRVWLSTQGVRDAPTDGYLAPLDAPGRALDSTWLVASSYFGAKWGLPLGVAVAAIVLARAARARGSPAFAAAFLGSSFLTTTFVIWSERFVISQSLGLNPVLRMVLVTTVVVMPLTAVMLEDAWRRTSVSDPPPFAAGANPRWRDAKGALAWSIIGASLFLYPFSALVGIGGPTLPGGRPDFPGQALGSQLRGPAALRVDAVVRGAGEDDSMSNPSIQWW